MTKAKPEPRDPAPDVQDLNAESLRFVALGVAQYAKKLADHAVKAQSLGRLKEGMKEQADADWLLGDLVVPILGDEEHVPTGKIEIQNRHLSAIHMGLGILVSNLKAAKGTLTALGKDKWVEQLGLDATYVEGQLQPRFAEQGELLPAESSSNGDVPPPPPASEVEGLRSQAEALADPE